MQKESDGHSNSSVSSDMGKIIWKKREGLAVKKPLAVITLKREEEPKQMVVELYPEKAPNTTNSFVDLVRQGFYDGLTIHRIVKDWVIQCGDPEGSCTRTPDFTIAGEFKINGFDNDLSHERGVISMARMDENYDSVGTQFFIVLKDAPVLDGKYPAFGKMIEGDELLDILAEIPVDETKGRDAPPFDPPVVEKIEIIDNGYVFAQPVRIIPAVGYEKYNMGSN